VGKQDGGAIDGLAINTTSGSLSQVPAAPYPDLGAAQNGTDGIAVTP